MSTPFYGKYTVNTLLALHGQGHKTHDNEDEYLKDKE